MASLHAAHYLQSTQAQEQKRRLSIVTTMRADLLEPWTNHSELIKTIQRDQAVWLGSLQGKNLQDAIVKPLEMLGYELEAVLLEQLLNDVQEEENCLPLLEFTLAELWEGRNQKTSHIKSEKYLEMGRLKGSLNRYAEKFYEYQDWQLPNSSTIRADDEKRYIKQIFMRLVRTDIDGKDTCQRQLYKDLLELEVEPQKQEIIKVVIDELVKDGRLLVAQEKGWISLCHEALLSAWNRLNEWRQEERELRILIDRLEDSVKEWNDKNQDIDFLLVGGRLKEAQELWPKIQMRSSKKLHDFYKLSLNHETSRFKYLENESIKRAAGLEKILQNLAQSQQQSVSIDIILQFLVDDLLVYFKSDRVIIYRISDWETVQLRVYATTLPWPLPPNHEPSVTWLTNVLQDWRENSYYPIPNVDQDDLTAAEAKLMAQLQVKAQLVVPIFQSRELWGLLALQQCSAPRDWQANEIELLQRVVVQLGIAIQMAELNEQVDYLNQDLEDQVQERTTQLQRALDWEAMLKRITDKVRDSLDEKQILQKAVQELALVLGLGACNTALYDLERQTSTIYFEYVTTLPGSQGRVAKMNDYPEIYNQLLQGQSFQFCSVTPSPVRGWVAMLACPIFDNEGVLGDLWLINQSDYAFSEREIRLIQQVANQCAIALRQAKLYQAAQAQVAELEKINQLKDEFLSMISHELRTPMTNMKMGILMLDMALKQRHKILKETVPNFQTALDAKVEHYLEILRRECERASQLINDLLDLQRPESDPQPIDLRTITLQDWLPSLVALFEERARDRSQDLYWSVASNIPAITTNLRSLERIFAELINNACKYTPSGGQIAIQAERDQDMLQLTVENSSVEIPALELAKVFDKFYRVPNNDPWKQGGTGLGLALCRKLSQSMGGDITVHSAEGKTWFVVTLPLNLSLES